MKHVLNRLVFLFHKLKDYRKHRTVTFEYPYANKHMHMFSRLKINNDFNECTGCKTCVETCPVDAISIKGEDLTAYTKKTFTPKGFKNEMNIDSFTIDYSKCFFCGLCVDDCPTDSLFFKKNFVTAKSELRFLTKDLKAEEKSKIKGNFL